MGATSAQDERGEETLDSMGMAALLSRDAQGDPLLAGLSDQKRQNEADSPVSTSAIFHPFLSTFGGCHYPAMPSLKELDELLVPIHVPPLEFMLMTCTLAS